MDLLQSYIYLNGKRLNGFFIDRLTLKNLLEETFWPMLQQQGFL